MRPKKSSFRNTTPKTQQALKHCLEENKHLSEKIWQGSSSNQATRLKNQMSTGYQTLDDTIGGWQLGVTTEIGLQRHGIGEFRLMIPVIKQLQSRPTGAKNIICINPPFTPYAPTLVKYGINLQRLTLIKPKTLTDILWSCEEVLLSGTSAATFCWTASARLTNTQLRRLQLAAEKHKALHILFRSEACLATPSVCSVRMSLSNDKYSRLNIEVKKQVGRWSDRACTLSVDPHYEKWQRQAVELWPLPKWQKQRPHQTALELVSEIHSDSLYLFPAQRILVAV